MQKDLLRQTAYAGLAFRLYWRHQPAHGCGQTLKGCHRNTKTAQHCHFHVEVSARSGCHQPEDLLFDAFSWEMLAEAPLRLDLKTKMTGVQWYLLCCLCFLC